MTDSDLDRLADEAQADIQRDLALLEAEDAKDAARAERDAFEIRGEGRYRFQRPGLSIEIDFLRRTGGALRGEVIVRTTIPGARTSGDVLSAEDLNLSSSRARRSFGLHLAERCQVEDFDFVGFVETFCIRVLAAERQGQPAVLLSDLPRPTPDEALEVDGLPLLARHPLIIFGDGGTTKSYIALYIAGKLAQRGKRVGFFDWELAGEDHRDRLERLFGGEMPPVSYARCTRPLFHELDRLRRIVRDKNLDFAIFDSIAPACDGPPESAETAGRYFQALRQLGEVGSLHTAHITKAQEGADRRPFGSTFWHNLARATWNVKLADAVPDDTVVTIALYNRKSNLGPLSRAVGFEFGFDQDRTLVRRVNPGDVPDLAASMSVGERIAFTLRQGPRTREQIRAALEDVKPSTLRSALHRAEGKGRILRFPDGTEERFSLPERWRS